MKITTIVPTYRRPKDLARCLESLKQQTRSVDELLIVVRDTDAESWLFLETFDHSTLPLQALKVAVPGVVEAMNIGLDAASGEIVSFTDDDAAPHPDWLERIEAYFMSDNRIGGVGGRDWLYCGAKLQELGERQVVGQVQWFGRVIGNHHLGVGTPRQVDVLKGVNMSFRRSAITSLRFDKRMRGTGAQVHFELAFTLTLKRAGWQIIYDPMIAVDHYPAQRFDEDRRNQFNKIALMNNVHNETLALLEYLSLPRQFIFLLWALLAGNRDARGILQWLRFFPSEGRLAGYKLHACLLGRWQGWQTWKQSRV
jgi:glycosyltransferase involved in cell wall biosynthesis